MNKSNVYVSKATNISQRVIPHAAASRPRWGCLEGDLKFVADSDPKGGKTPAKSRAEAKEKPAKVVPQARAKTKPKQASSAHTSAKLYPPPPKGGYEE